MRRLPGVLLLILLVVTFAGAAALDGDDHDDKAPIQTGYGVITPVAATTSGTTAGLVVFGTFGLRGGGGGGGTSQAGVLPPNLTSNAVLFVNSDGRLSKNL